MRKGLKNTLIFLGGAAVGGGAATLALRAFYTKFINETITVEIDNEINTIKEDYNQRLEDLKAKYEKRIVELEEEIGKKAEPVKKEPKKPADKKTSKKGRAEVQAEATDYTQFSKNKTKVKDVKAEAIRQIQEEKTNSDTGSYITSLGEFGEDNGYDKITLTFWAKDGVYSNDFDDPDMDAPGRIGTLIDKYDDYGDGESLYIRNDELEVDWEIIYNPGSYAEWCEQGEA